MDADGNDQNSGTNSIPGTWSEDDCYNECLKQTGATGCEWDIGGSCFVHTLSVSDGSGTVGFVCWILAPGKHVMLIL